jgi:hypothetical protein
MQTNEDEIWEPVPLVVNGITNYYELEKLKSQGVPLRVVRHRREDGSEWLRMYKIVK